MTSAERVLQVWFGPLDAGFANATHRRRWFADDAAFDRMISAEFAELLARATHGELTDWQAQPRGCLAYIVLTDQFSRQIHRGTAQAFATDSLALAAARSGIERGFDASLGADERSFFYMPFEHSEAIDDQNTAVSLFRALHDTVPQTQRETFQRTLRFAERHRDIIRRFGRFPHRNSVLGRRSSAAESDYLARASRFGQ
jgi:uncharacterized protein (DUF924 family)